MLLNPNKLIACAWYILAVYFYNFSRPLSDNCWKIWYV